MSRTLPLNFGDGSVVTAEKIKSDRPYQDRAILMLRQLAVSGVKRILCVGPTGCHAKGQFVMMIDGSLRAVENLDVGDKLMGPDSEARTVLKLIRGRGSMYRIVPVKGAPWIVNEDHVLTLVRTNADGQPHRDGELVDVSVREWLSWPTWRKHIHKLLRVGVSFEGAGDAPLDPYFLGVFLGDGWSKAAGGTPGIAVGQDEEIVRAVTLQAETLGMRVRRDESRGSANVVLYLVGHDGGKANRLKLVLDQLGILGSGSESKFIPQSYKIASRDARLDLLAGLIDTDGSLSNNTYDFVSKSRRLAEDVTFVARSVGLAAYVTECKKGCQTGAVGTYWRVCISGDTSVVPCRLSRKKAFERGQKKDALRTGFSVEPLVEDDFFYGFTLDRDGRYLLDDFTVTHNSGKMYLTASMIRTSTLPVLFIAHRRELLDHCAGQLAKMGISNVSVLRANDERFDPNASIQIASIATLARRDKPFAGEKVLIFIDEAHRAASDSYREIIDCYPGAIVIGFTATPVRLDGRPLGGDLFEEMLVFATYEELFKHPDWLARPIAFSAPIKPFLDHVPVHGSDFDETMLAAAMHTSQLEGQIVAHWLKYSGRHYGPDRKPGEFTEGAHRRTFVFAVNVSHSMAIADKFEREGVKVEHLDGNTKDFDRKNILKALGSGELEVVCNCNIAIEGVDVPEVKCIVGARPTHSLVLHRQQAGRMMRPWNDITPLLLDHASNWDRLGCPWEDMAWSLKGKPVRKSAISLKLCKTCFAYCEVSRVVCPYCDAEFSRESRSNLPAETTAALIERQGEPDAMKADFFARQMTQARVRGFKPGYPSALFKERYGAWPPREWSEKVKAEYEKDAQWQEAARIRLARKEKREAEEKREIQGMGEPSQNSIDMDKLRAAFQEKSFEERKLEQSLATMDGAEPDPWQLAPDVGTDFDDWLRGEGVK